MTTATNTTTNTVGIAADNIARRDRIARVLLAVAALGAVAATATAAAELSDIEGTARLAETWRLFGFPVFAGLFLILARAPRRVAGLWELVIANKIALVVAGATFLSEVEGSSDFVYVDGVLVGLLAGAYVLTRGWTAWSNQ